MVSVTWQAPRQSHGNVEGYRLTYGVLGESNVEERRLDGEKYRFTTAFLGKLAKFSWSRLFGNMSHLTELIPLFHILNYVSHII